MKISPFFSPILSSLVFLFIMFPFRCSFQYPLLLSLALLTSIQIFYLIFTSFFSLRYFFLSFFFFFIFTPRFPLPPLKSTPISLPSQIPPTHFTSIFPSSVRPFTFLSLTAIPLVSSRSSKSPASEIVCHIYDSLTLWFYFVSPLFTCLFDVVEIPCYLSFYQSPMFFKTFSHSLYVLLFLVYFLFSHLY